MKFPRIFQEGNVFYGTQEPFGCINIPLNLPGRGFTGISPEPKKSRGSSGPLWGLPIALCGPYGPVWALSGAGVKQGLVL